MTPKTTADILAGHTLPHERAAQPLRTAYAELRRYELDYETDGLHPAVTEAHRAVQWMLNDIAHRKAERSRWVSLLGKSGCGKTHLARAAVRVLRAEGVFRSSEAQVWTWREALRRVLDDAGVMDWLQRLPFLALDDIGTGYDASEKARALNASVLYDLLEGRAGRWTIITSNLMPANIASNLDVRIASRLYRGENIVVDMEQAGDFCLAHHKAGTRPQRPSQPRQDAPQRAAAARVARVPIQGANAPQIEPQNLTPEQRALLEEMKREAGLDS